MWRPMVERIAGLGRFGRFAARVARACAPPIAVGPVADQLWAVLVRCALPVLATTVPLGMVMALQALAIFDQYGAQRLLSSLVSVATFRELSPVLASVLVAAQGGSACAAELGAMRIREEIDATEVMAVDPVRVHVAPRMLALAIAAPVLNLAGSLGGVVGGWLCAVGLNGEPGGIYWANLWAMTRPVDLFGGIAKTAVFGVIIGLVACYHGFHATGGAPGVGRAVNDTVVVSCTAFVVANYFLSSALYAW